MKRAILMMGMLLITGCDAGPINGLLPKERTDTYVNPSVYRESSPKKGQVWAADGESDPWGRYSRYVVLDVRGDWVLYAQTDQYGNSAEMPPVRKHRFLLDYNLEIDVHDKKASAKP